MSGESNNVVDQKNVDIDEFMEELDITESITLSIRSNGIQRASASRGPNVGQDATTYCALLLRPFNW